MRPVNINPLNLSILQTCHIQFQRTRHLKSINCYENHVAISNLVRLPFQFLKAISFMKHKRTSDMFVRSNS